MGGISNQDCEMRAQKSYQRAAISTDPPLVCIRSSAPPDPKVPCMLEREMAPTIVIGKSLRTPPPEAEASTFKLTLGSSDARTEPPDVSSSPPLSFPRSNLTSTDPPEVLATTRPPASSM